LHINLALPQVHNAAITAHCLSPCLVDDLHGKTQPCTAY